MEDVLYDMEETPKLVFFAESDRRLFLSMKSKFRMHIGAWEYYSLESLLQLADLEENKSEFSLIREQLKEEYKTAALEQKNAGSIEEKLESVCHKYGMKGAQQVDAHAALPDAAAHRLGQLAVEQCLLEWQAASRLRRLRICFFCSSSSVD